MDESHLTALEADGDVVRGALDLLFLALGQGPGLLRLLCAVRRGREFRPHGGGILLRRLAAFGDDGCERTGAAAELAALARVQTDIEDQSPDGDHVEGQAVPSPGGSGSKNTGIDDSAHALPQVLRDTGHVALDDITGSHTIRGQDVAQFAGLLAPHEGDVGGPAGVVLDPLDDMRAGRFALKVDDTDSPLVTTAAMPDGDSAAAVPATSRLALLREGQLVDGTALPEVVVDRSPQVSDAGCPGLVGAQLDAGLVTGWGRSESDAGVEGGGGFLGRRGGLLLGFVLLDLGRVGAKVWCPGRYRREASEGEP